MTQESKKTHKIKKKPPTNVRHLRKCIMKSLNMKVIGLKVSEDSEVKGSNNILNKIIEEIFPTLKRDAHKEAYRTPNRWKQKRKSTCHIITKTLNTQNN